jgi:hypothetical protein
MARYSVRNACEVCRSARRDFGTTGARDAWQGQCKRDQRYDRQANKGETPANLVDQHVGQERAARPAPAPLRSIKDGEAEPTEYQMRAHTTPPKAMPTVATA